MLGILELAIRTVQEWKIICREFRKLGGRDSGEGEIRV